MKNNWKKNIVYFLSAQTISLFGSSLVQYAIIWYITLTTSSGKMLMLATLCGFLPQVGISLFAGAWVDRYDRKKLIMIADGMIAVSTLGLAITFMNGYRAEWMLFVVLIIRSMGTGIQMPAVNAILPQLVPQDKLMKVNGILSTCTSMMMFISPAVSGIILSYSSIEVTLLVDVITAIIGISITSQVLIQNESKKEVFKASMFQDVLDGFKYLKENKFIRNLLIFQMCIMFLISPSAFLTPLMISREFGEEVWRLTASEMTYSLGMVLGGVLISTWGGYKKKLQTTLVAGVVYGFFMIGLGLAPWFLLYCVFNACIGITSPCYNTPITVSIQEKVAPNMQGRVFSLMQITTSCLLPMGMLVFGPLADVISVQFILVSAGVSVLIVIGIFMHRKAF